MRDLTWFDWTLITYLIVGVGATAAYVGKPREPITQGTLVITFVINVLLVLGLLVVG